jgi:hypothetical protein
MRGKLDEGDDASDRILSIIHVIVDRAAQFDVEGLGVLAQIVQGGISSFEALSHAEGFGSAILDEDAGQRDILDGDLGVGAEVALVAEVYASGDA